jgi:peroxiredoxin
MRRISAVIRRNEWAITMTLFLTFALLSFLACNRQPSVFSYSLENLNGEMVDFQMLKSRKATVFITLSPDCPLCQKYSLSFRELDSIFSQENIEFIGVFPGEYYSLEEMKNYVYDFEIPFQCVLDPQMLFTNRLGAEVTPEVFVFSPDERLVYSGAIDNWAVTVRKHRQVVNAFYLRDAVQSILDETQVKTKRVEPVGCLIQ